MKAFSEQLPTIAGGALDQELTDALADVLEYISAKGGSPEITAKIKLQTQLTKAGPMVKVAYTVSVKLPKEKPVDFSMFLSEDGNLLLDNPRQQPLPFKEVKIDTKKPEVIPAFAVKEPAQVRKGEAS